MHNYLLICDLYFLGGNFSLVASKITISCNLSSSHLVFCKSCCFFNFKHKLIAGSTQGIIICIFKDLIFCSKSSIISLLPHFLPIIDFAIIEIGLYSSKSYENIFIEIFRFPPLLIKDFAKEYLFPPPINKIFTFFLLFGNFSQYLYWTTVSV